MHGPAMRFRGPSLPTTRKVPHGEARLLTVWTDDAEGEVGVCIKLRSTDAGRDDRSPDLTLKLTADEARNMAAELTEAARLAVPRSRDSGGTATCESNASDGVRLALEVLRLRLGTDGVDIIEQIKNEAANRGWGT